MGKAIKKSEGEINIKIMVNWEGEAVVGKGSEGGFWVLEMVCLFSWPGGGGVVHWHLLYDNPLRDICVCVFFSLYESTMLYFKNFKCLLQIIWLPIFKNKICIKIRIRNHGKNLRIDKITYFEQFLSWISVVILALFLFHKVTSK